MTADYDPTEAQRLISGARRLGYAHSATPPVSSVLALADQLEAAGMEVERYRQGCERADKAYSLQREARDTAERERDSLRRKLEAAQRERDEALTDGVLSQRVCDIENDLAQSRSDLAAAQQRVAALEADLKAAPLPGVALDLKLADKRIAELEAASDTYAKRGDESHDRERATKDEYARYAARHADDLEMFRATEADLAHNRRRADAAESDLAAAQRRISELMEALDDAIQHDDDAAALRAIWPVYRVLVAFRSRAPGRHAESTFSDVWNAADAARAALTPEILAALKAAGLEIE